jgi:hypothetical protein
MIVLVRATKEIYVLVANCVETNLDTARTSVFRPNGKGNDEEAAAGTSAHTQDGQFRCFQGRRLKPTLQAEARATTNGGLVFERAYDTSEELGVLAYPSYEIAAVPRLFHGSCTDSYAGIGAGAQAGG